MSVGVTPATLRSAAQVWGEQADSLRGAAAGLDRVETGAVGPRAEPALRAWSTHWAARLAWMQAESQQHDRALAEAAERFATSDNAAADDLAALRGLLAGEA